MSQYNSSYTGQQIDTAIGKALNPDTTPTASSSALITSGAVKSALSAYDVYQTVVTSRADLISWLTGIADTIEVGEFANVMVNSNFSGDSDFTQNTYYSGTLFVSYRNENGSFYSCILSNSFGDGVIVGKFGPTNYVKKFTT